MSTVLEIENQAQSLSAEDRARLAHNLIASLDDPAEAEVTQAWRDEIARRVSRVKNGNATLLTREEFSERMRAKLG